MELAKQMLHRAVGNMDKNELFEICNDLWIWAGDNHFEGLAILLEDPELFPNFFHMNEWEIELSRTKIQELMRDSIDFTEEVAQQFLQWYAEVLGGEL